MKQTFEKVSQNNAEKQEKINIVPVQKLIKGINLEGYDPKRQYVEGYKGRHLIDNFSEMLYSHFVEAFEEKEKLTERFKTNEKLKIFIESLESLKGQIVVDLGAGPHVLMYCMANKLGARAYIGVDKFTSQKWFLASLNDEIRNKGIKNLHTPLAYMEGEDMHVFLRRLPSNSVSIITSGIDLFVVDKDHREAVAKEIARVLSPQGCYLSYSSNIDIRDKEITEYDLDSVDYPSYLVKETKVYKKNNKTQK